MTSKVNLQITSENMTLPFVLQTLITKQSAQISNLVKPSLVAQRSWNTRAKDES